MICGNCEGSGFKKIADLHRHQDECYSRGWQEVINLRLEGQLEAAAKKARKLMGIKSEPMAEETKEQLRKHYEEHKEEIEERKKMERKIQKSIKERLKNTSKNIKRKNG